MRLMLMILTVLALWLSGAEAHVGPLIYPIYEIPTADLPDLHDGTLEDWEDIFPRASLDYQDFLSVYGGDIDPADLAHRVYLAWHSATQRLYVAIERLDDMYINTYEGGDLSSLWLYDSVEFMVDSDHSGGDYNGLYSDPEGSEELKLFINAQAQQYRAIAVSPDNRTLTYLGAGQDWVTLPPYADAGGFQRGESPNLSGVELYVTPWDQLDWRGAEYSVPGVLVAGRIIGFQIALADFDTEPGNYTGFYAIFGGANAWRTADDFVDGELIPCDFGDCGAAPEISAVGRDSWGRIKASFR